MMSKKKSFKIFGFLFLIISFYSIYKLRNNYFNDYSFLLLTTLICVATDLGGYIFGKLFKGPKLTKHSPNKTYSGMIGGFFLSIILVNFFLENSLYIKSTKMNLDMFVYVIFISSVSQLGDIIISYFKRLSKIKDTGKIIPGHGGLLDRVDGMIFAFPISYLILLINLI
jgi:phosphatidate cytidylyltransferase